MNDVTQVFVSVLYIYLFLIFVKLPNAKIPLVELPAAAPKYEFAEDDAADPFESQAYVYLFLINDVDPQTRPNANIPTVAVPAAAPSLELLLAHVAELFASVANVYLFRVFMPAKVPIVPSAKMPTVPDAAPAAFAANPNPCAENAPFVTIAGIFYPHLYCVSDASTLNVALAVLMIV